MLEHKIRKTLNANLKLSKTLNKIYRIILNYPKKEIIVKYMNGFKVSIS